MRLNASAKIPNPLSLAPQKKGTVGRPKCLRDGIRGVSTRFRVTAILSKDWPGSHWNSPCSFVVLDATEFLMSTCLAEERFSWP